MQRRTWLFPLCLALGLTTVACEDEESEAPAPAQAPAAAPEKAAEAPAASTEPAASDDDRLAYSYNPIGKRDPFRSFIDKDPAIVDMPLAVPTQKFEIDQYKLVGIIWGVDNPVAMVEDPDGMGHFLQKDTLLGRNWGKVVRISPSEVIVAEEYRDFEGKLIVNEIPLQLPPGKE